MCILASASEGLSAGPNVWTHLGPESGIVTSFAIDPQNPATVYAASCMGLFKSTDEGISWNSLSPGPPLCISVLVINPKNPSTIYALTQSEGNLLKSTDGGANWTSADSGLPNDANGNNAVTSLVIDPQSPVTLYAGDAGGVFKTFDGGDSWNAANSGLPESGVMALAINPQSPSTIYASTRKGGISQSMDGGASWSTVNSGLDNFIIQGYDYISALAIDSQDPNTVYAARHDVCEDCTAALFRTTDNGASWTATTLGRADTVISLATDPQILGTIYAGTSVGIFSSTDGGARWNAVKSRLTSDSYGRLVIPALAIDPQNSAIVYAATSSAGIFKTTDAGATWTIVNSDLKATTPTDVTVLRIDPQNPGTMYAMTDEGIFKTSDAGATWIGVNAGLPLSPVFDIASNKVPTLSALEIAPQGPSTIYAVDACCQEIFKSTDDGASWNTTLARGADGIVLKGARLSARSLAIDTHDPPTVYAAGWYTQSGPGPMPGNGLFKSTDAGGHWIWIGTGLPNSLMTSVAVDPLNPEVVYAGTAVGGPLTPGFGLFKTTNGGRSWKKAGLDGFSSRVDVVGIDPQDSNILYAVAYSQSIPWPAYPGGFGFLFKSTNGGASWTGINSGFPNYVTALAINPQYPNTLYAGTPFGVFRSIDGGANWDAINSGLTSPAVTSLAIAPQDPNTVYAATTDGVFAITFGP